MDDPGQRNAGGDNRDRQMYEEDRTKRLRRGRLVGYVLCIALWLFSAVPLARLSSEEGGGALVTVVYLAAGLGIALVSRGIYTKLTRRPFLSPWLFAIAAVLAWHAATDPKGPGLAAFLFAAVVGYAAGAMSLSRTYVIPTYLVLALATAYLNVADRDPPHWYRVHGRLLKYAALLGVAGLIGTKVFVMTFARYGGG